MKAVKGFIFLFLFLSVQGCSSPSLILDIKSDETLNQDVRGQNFSVLVRVYQLTSPEYFEQADYHALLAGDVSALGESLLAQEEFIVEPGRDYELQFQREEGAEYKALAAFFRQVEGDQWQAVRQLDNGVFFPMTTQSKIRLINNRILIIGKQ